MKLKTMALLIALILTINLAACGANEEITLSGMVVSVDDTVITFAETDGEMEFSPVDRPEMPEGMEDFEGFENFNPEDFAGQMPQMPEGMIPPEDGEMPQMPEGGERPEFDGEMGGRMPNMENFAADLETTEYDLADAHISVEIDGGKESGSMDNIKPGTFVTLTVNGKGKVTYVLVSAQTGFGGGRRPAN